MDLHLRSRRRCVEGTRELTRTWYVQDRCGNIGQDTQTITVTDSTAPVGSVMDDSVACADYDAATEYGSNHESDNCDLKWQCLGTPM